MSGRSLPPALVAALVAPGSQPSLFVSITFATATAYLWSGLGSVTWGGHTWLGLGALMGVTASEDAATVEARGIAITISGLEPTLFADCRDEFRLGLPVALYLGFWSGGALVSDPVVVWSGRTDQPESEVGPDNVTVTIGCESRLVEMNIAADQRLTNETQQLYWPGDLGLQFVDGLQEAALFWGQTATVTTNV
jgi:hypothetical protein